MLHLNASSPALADSSNTSTHMAADVARSPQIRVITLNNGHLRSTLCRIEKGWILEFQLGASLFGKDISLYTNQPPDHKTKFERENYYLLEWMVRDDGGESKHSDDTCYYTQLTAHTAGPFEYYFSEKSGESEIKLGSGYFIVNPTLTCGPDNETMLLGSIQCQTVLSKCLGPFSEWENRLRVSKECGYNMIHFTPIQELGGSRSSYCIKDQLKLNPSFSKDEKDAKFEDINDLIQNMQKKWGVLSICDIVLNHTANESTWILEHPECTYNMITAPHLIPAAILDGYLHVFSQNVASGMYEEKGIPSEITSEDHLQAIRCYLETELIENLQLGEYYLCNVEKLTEDFKKLIKVNPPAYKGIDIGRLELIHNCHLGRYSATVDMDIALKIFNRERESSVSENTRISDCIKNFKDHLGYLNVLERKRINDHLISAINNCICYIRYHRLQPNGPKIKEMSVQYPLLPRYFTGEFEDFDSVEKFVLHRGELVMAHNGWVMNFDPLKNFASKEFNVYLRRELLAWGDSVKLRYGESYSDSPFLWDHMRKYVEMTAIIFHGVRLDNCHSTPLAVAEYLLDCARKIRPDLYVIAELFTNSDETDNIFINRLGITSLIREAMSAWNSHELGRLVYRFGGESVGSFEVGPKRPVVPSVAHALFYDVTHDNESPVEKRTVFYTMATTAMVNMACCATASTRGFDELVPHQIHVVNEERLYASWTDANITSPNFVNKNTGLIAVKKMLNLLHKQLNDDGYSQVFVDQMNENIVAITRHNPSNHNSVILVSYTAFAHPSHSDDRPHIKNLVVEGVFEHILLEASLEYVGDGDSYSKPTDFTKDPNYINGLMQYKVNMKENITVELSDMIERVTNENDSVTEYTLKCFKPGSIIIAKLRPCEGVEPNLKYISRLTISLLENKCDDLLNIVSGLTLADLNHALYKCSAEEAEDGSGAYEIPGYGPLVYCGLQGFESILSELRYKNDLGHPFCENLRQGNWMLDYVSERLKWDANTQPLGIWFENIFEKLRCLPRFLIPKYFDMIISSVTNLLLSCCAFQMSDFVKNGSRFVRLLAMGSVQCTGIVESAHLPSFSPSLNLSEPNLKYLTMCAGLPHFVTGCMRQWGRDTFIALRGLLLITGRHETARCHILGYASCLRHGLIPNLLDSGVNARYNARDAVWWWLYAITNYVNHVPNGFNILKDPVSRVFPDDNSPHMPAGLVDQPLYDVMQEALTVHFQGLRYKERNAGTDIDSNMTNAGFHNVIGVDLYTGFVFGGNEYNCGTWMDKMGSSSIACNRGRPATPRDGSAVELVGLCKAVLRELIHFHAKGWYPYDSVTRTSDEGDIKIKWTFKEWGDKITCNFDKHFWIDLIPSDDDDFHLIHRRGIYKDSYDATHPWADYQLRCNFPIALAVAPEMVDPERAWKAIEKAEVFLLGPLGMKTLDPADWNYSGDYNNDDNSNNPKIAQGFNYHQGPEWVWPVGFFLRAKLHFAKLRGPQELRKTVRQIRSYLGTFYDHILSSQWRGLPELTNRNGAYCKHSCNVQAWSIACIMEVLYDLDNLYDVP